MKDRHVFLSGYRGQISTAVHALMEEHGARVSACFIEDETHIDAFQERLTQWAGQTASLDSMIYIAPPVQYHAIEDIDVQLAEQTLRRGVMGLHVATQAVLPLMKRRREGTVVAVTSDYALTAVPGVSLYSATAAAMNAYLRAVSLECCKFGIRCNCVMPGFSIGENGDAYAALHGSAEAEDAFRRYQVIPRRGTCADVADAVLFCASALSNFITGEAFPVDGGALAIGHSQVWNPKEKPAFSLTLKEKTP
jgi:NAD(P)-dependent dehydrogenase (short-subunit alcohol dehydrogenase family)